MFRLNQVYLILFSLILILVGCVSYYKGPVSSNFNGKEFYHNFGEDRKSLWQLLKWQLTGEKAKWPDYIDNPPQKIPTEQPDPQKIEITFINHASVYIRHEGLKFITDPHWSPRASPVSFAGPKRVRNPGIKITELPGLDYVLLSHNHYDHFDQETLKNLKDLYDPTFLIPLGDAYLMKEVGISKFIEMDWWQKQTVTVSENRTIEFTFVPVKHWSARGLTDRNRSLWGGFVILSPTQKIFFAGDTGYCDIFKELSQRFGSFSLSLLPIGAYEPRWFMHPSHMNPQEAVQAHVDLKSQFSLGIHFGFWQLTDEGMEQPQIDLELALKKAQVSKDSFFTLELGQSKSLF